MAVLSKFMTDVMAKLPTVNFPDVFFKFPQKRADVDVMLRQLCQFFIDQLPFLRYIAMEILETVFAPKHTIKMVFLAVSLQSTLVIVNGACKLIYRGFESLTAKGRLRREIMEKMNSAMNFASWRRAALDLDRLNGVDKWRTIEESSFYDHKLLRKRITDINAMIRKGDTFALMFRFRGGLARDQYGMQHEGLFSKAAAGTKELVEEYHETVSQALEFIAQSPSSDEVV